MGGQAKAAEKEVVKEAIAKLRERAETIKMAEEDEQSKKRQKTAPAAPAVDTPRSEGPDPSPGRIGIFTI